MVMSIHIIRENNYSLIADPLANVGVAVTGVYVVVVNRGNVGVAVTGVHVVVVNRGNVGVAITGVHVVVVNRGNVVVAVTGVHVVVVNRGNVVVAGDANRDNVGVAQGTRENDNFIHINKINYSPSPVNADP